MKLNVTADIKLIFHEIAAAKLHHMYNQTLVIDAIEV